MSGKPKITWLGHGTTLIQSPGGKKILVDAWTVNNPATPKAYKDVSSLADVDVLVITHGHFDHIDDAVAICKANKPRVVAIYETAVWLGGKGVEKVTDMNKGGTVMIDGISITMTHAIHSCGIMDGGKIVYGGEAAGYVLGMENGTRVYHSGDTTVFGDMKLIGDIYRPDVAVLPIGGHYTMGPREAAVAIQLLGVQNVIPVHHSTFPLLAGTPDALREALGKGSTVSIHGLKPGESWQ